MPNASDGTPCEGPRQVRAVEPEDGTELLQLWRETWASTYGPTMGDETLQTMLLSLDKGTTAMLPGRGERGYVISEGRRIIGSAVAAERGAIAYL